MEGTHIVGRRPFEPRKALQGRRANLGSPNITQHESTWTIASAEDINGATEILSVSLHHRETHTQRDGLRALVRPAFGEGSRVRVTLQRMFRKSATPRWAVERIDSSR
jgi:hypothetical protein